MFLTLSMTAALALGAEGKWTPQQVLQQGPAWVKQQGFSLPLSKLWDEKAQGGLLANAVQLPGCSGSFVSKDGLLITNHHCIVSILQEHSTPEHNLTKDGFLAKTQADEKQSKAYRVLVPRRFLDVTKDVLDDLPNNPDDLARYKSVEATGKKLVANCEKQPNTRCTFAVFDGGLFFTLTEFTELSDARLVYAPPVAVGDYGGEVDNWTWPRHTGDFSLIRIYQNGKPYQPKYFFPLSKDGVKENDAVAVLGYPGSTFRAQLADEMAERQSRWYPNVRAITAEWQRIMDEEGAKSPEALIACADDLRSILNVKKNAEGQLAGLKRGRIIEKQRAHEEKVKAFIAKKPELAPALDAYKGLQDLNVERAASWDRDFLLDMTNRSARGLQWPLLIARRSWEAKLPDAEREPGYQERDVVRLREKHERDQKRYAQQLDQRLFVSWVKRALALPNGQRSVTIDFVFKDLKTDAAIEKKVAALYANSKIFDLETRKAMFDESIEQLKARKDALVDLGLGLDAERRALRDRRDAFSGRVLKLRPIWRRAVIASEGKPIAPDANSTLRVSFGRVKGYSPREAVMMTPHTTLAGVMAKDTGEEPFDVPQRIRDVYARGGAEKVPVDFLADLDTTGGNSGSPVIDAKGRLVGVNFDRVWENVANDFGYNPDVARNVTADVRYLLWLLENVEGAPELAKELTTAR
ncbi:MAG: S46 family peptidase [Archangium gephyra]|uniref:Dipeptidyl-peptidase n=1 Tax=Archangium gephyra TaxID=48 RepID=A0A2W5TAW6_9BACT|nr:MAG: S46 family peptidase [Archangium gephyra]